MRHFLKPNLKQKENQPKISIKYPGIVIVFMLFSALSLLSNTEPFNARGAAAGLNIKKIFR